MAISFKKEVIAEAIKEVLAESQQVYLITNDPQSKDDAIKAAQKAGAKDPQFYKQIKDMKPGDTITAEDHHEDPNDESDMAKVQLANVIHYAQELLTMIKDGQQLDAWVQSKLTIAFDYIDSVKHYLEGEDYLAATEAPAEEEDLQAEAKKRGEKTVRKELDIIKSQMMDLAKRWKAGDKSVLDQLKALTAQKKALERELEKIVSRIGVGQELSGDDLDEVVTEDFAKFDTLKMAIVQHEKGTPYYDKTRLINIFNQLDSPDQERAKREYSQYFGKSVKEASKKKLDPVSKKDSDINNDGKVDKTDKYLKNKRVKIGQAIASHKK